MTENTDSDHTPASNDATLQGLLIANGGLVILALLPIVIGAIRSVNQKQQLKDCNDQLTEQKGADKESKNSSRSSRCSEPQTATSDTCWRLSMIDAIKMPFIASGVLFAIYVLFKIFSKEYIGPLISCYFCVLGVLALSQLISPLGNRFVPHFVRTEPYHLILIKGTFFVFIFKHKYF